MKQVIGTCSKCGGSVSIPSPWMGVNPPTPRCDGCGRKPKAPHGPVIDMEETKFDFRKDNR